MRNHPAVAALLFTIVFSVAACDGNPMGPIPGGALQGDLQDWPGDWAFTNEVENVFVETNPLEPYSVTLWGVEYDSAFYIAGANSESTWVANLLLDPRLKVAVGSNLYAARVTRVDEPSELKAVLEAYVVKYEIEADDGSNFMADGGILFKLQRP